LSVPRVSVLLPVRDAAATLGDCLDSLAAQTLADHEVVAVDDGSRDGSGDLLRARARADPRLRVLSTPPAGLVSALNRALAGARAALVARMDADDRSRRDRLALQAERLERDAAVDVLGCRVRLAGAGGFPGEGMRAYVRWQNALLDHDAMARDRFVESPLVHPSVAMRRAALEGLGGWRDVDGPEDYDLWLRAFAAGLRFAKLAEVLLDWRDSPGRLTRTDPRYAPERFLALKLGALARGPLAGGRAAVVWGAGPVGKTWSRALRAAGHEVRAFVEVNPRKVGTRMHGVPVVAVDAAGELRGPLHLAAVGQPGARERIRAEAARLGLVEGADFVAVA
jgi:cellulose synthase/poly-beta-1,6-N-acetylglucosamine synthase-like glycosyltransferase